MLPPSSRQLAGSAAAFTLVYLNPPDSGVVLRLRLSEPTSVGASVVNVTYGLDRDAGVLRPPHIIAGSENLTDVTLIRREFHFN